MKFYLGLLVILVVTCNQVQEEQTELQGINWQGIVKCFKNVMPLVPEVKEIINLIKKFKIKKAFSHAMKLFKEGKEVIKDCIAGFKKPKNLSAAPPKIKKRRHFGKCFKEMKEKNPNMTHIEILKSEEFKECKENQRKLWQENCMKTKCKVEDEKFCKRICKNRFKIKRFFKGLKPKFKPTKDVSLGKRIKPPFPIKPFPIKPIPKPYIPLPVYKKE